MKGRLFNVTLHKLSMFLCSFFVDFRAIIDYNITLNFLDGINEKGRVLHGKTIWLANRYIHGNRYCYRFRCIY